MKGIVGVLLAVCAILVGVYLLNPFHTATLDPRGRLAGYVPYTAPGSAMIPTIKPGDSILVQTSAYARREPRVGEIVAFFPPESGRAYVFRIIGTSGDRLQIVAGRVHRNGSPADEQFADTEWKMPYAREMAEVVVPQGELFLLGDNRDNANDSRVWGTVATDAVIGRAVGVWDVGSLSVRPFP
jgi:signal peptidase I